MHYYLLVTFTYTTSDFQGDNERRNSDHLIYFYNTPEECESKYTDVKDNLLKKYNIAGRQTHGRHEDYFYNLDEDDIDYTIDLVKISS